MMRKSYLENFGKNNNGQQYWIIYLKLLMSQGKLHQRILLWFREKQRLPTLIKKVIEEGVELFKKEKEVGAVVIPEKSFGIGFWTKFKVFEREFYEGEDSIEAARFFRRTLFNKFGGYDKSITGPEDWDLPLRMRKAGIKIGRVKSFILHNERKFSPLKSARKKFYYASHARKYFKKHPEMVLSQGNLLLRPVFFKKWKKLILNPYLSLGMFLVRSIEMSAALFGIILSNTGKPKNKF